MKAKAAEPTYTNNGTSRQVTAICPSCHAEIILWKLPDDDETPTQDVWNALCSACDKLIIMMLYHELEPDDRCVPYGVLDPPPPPDFCDEDD